MKNNNFFFIMIALVSIIIIHRICVVYFMKDCNLLKNNMKYKLEELNSKIYNLSSILNSESSSNLSDSKEELYESIQRMDDKLLEIQQNFEESGLSELIEDENLSKLANEIIDKEKEKNEIEIIYQKQLNHDIQLYGEEISEIISNITDGISIEINITEYLDNIAKEYSGSYLEINAIMGCISFSLMIEKNLEQALEYYEKIKICDLKNDAFIYGSNIKIFPMVQWLMADQLIAINRNQEAKKIIDDLTYNNETQVFVFELEYPYTGKRVDPKFIEKSEAIKKLTDKLKN